MPVWMRGRFAVLSASAATSMSFATGAGQAADDGGVADLVADPPHALEIAGARDREAGLDDVDAETHELPRDLDLFRRVHARARRLLAVAQRRVEYFYDCAHSIPPRRAATAAGA